MSLQDPVPSLTQLSTILAWAAAAGSATAQDCGQPWTPGPGGPPARDQHAMAFDSARGVAVMVGGRNNATFTPDTWEWNPNGAGGNGAWILRATGGPAARYSMALAFDPARGRTVLFGGNSGSANPNDTWEWDGVAWALRNSGVGAPPGRTGAVMAFDQARSRIVMHGGLRDDLCCTTYTDTWEWDGAAWTQMAAAGPPHYPAVGMTLDAASGRAVLLAADASNHFRLWQWDGGTWLILPGDPPQTRDATLVDNGRVTLIGRTGVQVFGVQVPDARLEAWTWNGSSWAGRDTSGPSSRAWMAAAFDGRRVILFGGAAQSLGGPAFADAWLYDQAVRSGPWVTATPQARSVNPGDPVQFTVAASSPTPLSYQWRRGGAPIVDGGAVSGATTPQLTISAASGAFEGLYDVAVSDACGATTVGSVPLDVFCYANCDNSNIPPVLNVLDFSCFMGQFAAASTRANCDGSTIPPVLNVLDFTCFLNAFAAGCP